MKFLYVFIIALFLVACSKESKPEVAYPKHLPVTEKVEGISKVPEYQPPTDGKVVAISKGDVSEMDGICLDEKKAFASADLRTNYDEVYQLYLTDRKLFLFVVQTQEQQLFRGDQIIAQKEADLKKIRDSWWQRNKLSIGIGIGVVVGAAVVLAGGRIWAYIEEEQDR